MQKLKVKKSEEEWKKDLSSEQYQVCRQAGTEAPFSGKYYTHSESGLYTCAACAQILFSSEAKFDSGSGWPSFFESLDSSVERREDSSQGMQRTEITCSSCDSHLGHVFPDGPEPTGQRYCVNSLALNFNPNKNNDCSSK